MLNLSMYDFNLYFLAPLRGLSARNSPAGGFLSPNSVGRRSNILGGTGSSIGGTPNRLNSLKKEGGIKVGSWQLFMFLMWHAYSNKL